MEAGVEKLLSAIEREGELARCSIDRGVIGFPRRSRSTNNVRAINQVNLKRLRAKRNPTQEPDHGTEHFSIDRL